MTVRKGVVAGLVLALGVPVLAGGMHGRKAAAGKDLGQAKIGEPAPDFKLAGIDGKSYKLSDFAGKVVVLEWINHECPVSNRCHDQKVMTGTLSKFDGKPVVWLAIDSSHFAEDKLSDIKAWVKKRDLPYPYLIDASGEVGHKYGAKTTPHMFVIDQKGNLAYMGAPNNNPYGDKKAGVRNYVAEAITALLDGSEVATTTTKSFGCSVKYKTS